MEEYIFFKQNSLLNCVATIKLLLVLLFFLIGDQDWVVDEKVVLFFTF